MSDIHQSVGTAHVNAVFRTGPWASQVVAAGDLVSACTMLVTPALCQQ